MARAYWTTKPDYIVDCFDGEFTFEGWFNTDNYANTFQNIFSSDDASTLGRFTSIIQNDNRMYFGINGVFISTLLAVYSHDAWHHVAVTRNAAELITIWLDGVSVASGTNAATFGPDIGAGASAFCVGKGLGGGDNADLDAWFDQIRITKGVCRYTATFTPPTEPFPAG